MVKIRYSELPAGLHVAAAADREGTVVYLQPGLTSAQRRAALTRVRSSARMGRGPTLPRRAMARAIAADRVRTNARIGAAAARRHPMLFLPPVVLLLVSAVAFMLMSIQPLTATTQGNARAESPGLRIDGQQGQRQHHQQAVHRPGRTSPALLRQQAPPPSCASPSASAGRQSWWAPPTRTRSRLPAPCLSHPQHWARTHRL